MKHFPRLWTREESDAAVTSLQKSIGERGWGFWAVEVRGVSSFIGFVGLAVPRMTAHFTSPIAKSRLRRFLPASERRDFHVAPCVEIGWRLAPEFWGRGYATEAANASLRYGFEQLILKEIVAFTVPLNERSRAVMKRIGMTHDPADDFDHPHLPVGDPLRRHVLYRMTRSDWDRVYVPGDA